MWQQIRSNQIRSIILVVGMGALLLLIGYALGIVFFDNGAAGLIIAVVLWLILNLVAFLQGDKVLLAVSGARKVSYDENPQLYNVVEEMKIASGLPKMPEIYIINDPAPNAFATGRSPNRSAVAVTTGLLDIMDRNELQGVIAHEMSHIVNRDVLLMCVAGVFFGTIVLV
jgi:heat shock protein HtpX